MTSQYWRGPVEDRAMQDEHGFLWMAILDTIDLDPAGRRVLDCGCNRGGFLRLLADRHRIAEGYGYDPAAAAVADAERLAADRPLRFAAADTVPSGWGGFDLAFSHEVLYLLPDMAAHAEAVRGALGPGGVYYATMGVHADSVLMAGWHRTHREELGLPPLQRLDDIADVFRGAGFDVAAGRLRLGFVPVDAHRDDGSDRGRLLDWLEYYTRDKVLFRLAPHR